MYMLPHRWSALLLCLILPLALAACGEKSGTGENGQTGVENTPDRMGNPADTLAGTEAGQGTVADGFISYADSAVAGATVYIPVYSHIYQRSRQLTFNLTATLSLRNTDLSHSITIRKVYYFDSRGELVERFLDRPVTLEPLASTSYVIEEEDLRGGVGANFMVLWDATSQVNRPVFEAVMISTARQQGISLISTGREVHKLKEDG